MLLSRCSIRSLACGGHDAQLAREHVHLASSSVSPSQDRLRFVAASATVASSRPFTVLLDLSHNPLTKATVLDATQQFSDRHPWLFQQSRVDMFVKGPFCQAHILCPSEDERHNRGDGEGLVKVIGTDVGIPLRESPLLYGETKQTSSEQVCRHQEGRTLSCSRRLSWWWVAGFFRAPTFLPPHSTAAARGRSASPAAAATQLRRSGTFAHSPLRYQGPASSTNSVLNGAFVSSSRKRMVDTLSEISAGSTAVTGRGGTVECSLVVPGSMSSLSTVPAMRR